jgi:hypothetical protein
VQNDGEGSRQEIPLEDDRQIHTIRMTTGQRPGSRTSDTPGRPSVVV